MWPIGRTDPRAPAADRSVRLHGAANCASEDIVLRRSKGPYRGTVGGFRPAKKSWRQESPPKENPAPRAGLEESLRQSTRLRTAGAALPTPGDCTFVSAHGREGKLTCRKKHSATGRVVSGMEPKDRSWERHRSDAAGCDVTVDLSLVADENDSVTGRVASVPLHFLVRHADPRAARDHAF